MMRCFVIMFFSCATLLNAQQDWDLFPLQQQTWFQENDSIAAYYCDSIIENGTERKHLFGANYLYAIFGECTEEILPEFWQNEGINAALMIDTLHSNDTCWFLPLASDTLRFKHLANLGESWYIPTASQDSFLLTCSDISEFEFLGFTDSVKTFSLQYYQNGSPVAHPLNGETFELAKQAGFLRFIPLTDLYFFPEMSVPHNLIGMRKANQNYAYTSTFTDYFHYEIGDILKWHTYDLTGAGFNNDLTEEWFIDTIIGIDFFNGLLRLDVNRTIYTETSEFGSLTNAETDVGIDAVFAISQILMDSFLVTPNQHPVTYFERLRYLREGAIQTNFGISDTANFITPKTFDLSGCSMDEGEDLAGSFVLNSELGFKETRLNLEGNDFYLLELLGYQSSDFTWGELDPVPIISSNLEVSTQRLNLFPNPAAEFINITYPQNVSKLDYNVYKVQGGLIQSGEITSNRLDVSKLPKGMYILHLKTQKENYQATFVVSRK